MPATVAGVSETINAMSRFWPLFEPLPVPMRLMSQNTPLARKPLGAMMEPPIFLNECFIGVMQAKICESRARLSNFYRVNFQTHHPHVHLAGFVWWKFCEITPRGRREKFLAQIFRHALRVRDPC